MGPYVNRLAAPYLHLCLVNTKDDEPLTDTDLLMVPVVVQLARPAPRPHMLLSHVARGPRVHESCVGHRIPGGLECG